MNMNQKAIQLLEENRIHESIKLFQNAAATSRDVQSLHNLAWIYCNEEDNDRSALPLLEEAIEKSPTSHFPYNLLGEIYCRQEKWESAKRILEKGISIKPSKPAYNNLAVAHYHLKNKEEASNYFLLGSEPSDYAMYSHIICLIELGHHREAKRKLDAFSEKDDEFVGEVEVAELYVELGCYQEALEWFEKAWDVYYKHSSWILRYIYSLLKMNQGNRVQERLDEVINGMAKEIKEISEEECDEDWTESDKEFALNELLKEKKECEQMIGKISSGYIPTLEFTPSIQKACYLFGCNRHNHPEYLG